MIVGIDPKVDYAFKHLFGRDQNKDILIHVLDSILQPAPGQHIQDLELLNPFNPKEDPDDKLSVLDIKARDQAGRQFNVEMQMLPYLHYGQRILYYACKLHQQQFHEGQDYHELRPTISISFLNHVRFRGLADYHLCFRLLEQKHQVALTGDLEFHLLELPKFRKTEQEVAPGLEVWLYFLRHAEKIDTEAVPRALQQPMVLRALEELKMLTQSDLERERYEARRKAQLDHNSYLNEARRLGREEGRQEGRQEGWQEGRQEGWQEGRQEGWQEGRQEGWQEGRQQGRTEGEKTGLIGNIQMCEQLLDRPETPADQLAGFSLEELNRLSQELQRLILKTKRGK